MRVYEFLYDFISAHQALTFCWYQEQKISQYLFEETFNLEFKTIFDQYNVTRSGKAMESIGTSMLDKVHYFYSSKVTSTSKCSLYSLYRMECVCVCV